MGGCKCFEGVVRKIWKRCVENKEGENSIIKMKRFSGVGKEYDELKNNLPIANSQAKQHFVPAPPPLEEMPVQRPSQRMVICY
jgi:hypothetical protein